MKKPYLIPILLLATVFGNITAQSCLPDGITFRTQAQLDSFPIKHPGCRLILGDVLIKENTAGAIANLNNLAQISQVDGSLFVWQNASLTSLKGLDNITSIGKHLSVNLNKALPDLNGMGKLDSIHGNFGLISNDALTSLNGLNHLAYIGESCEISSNLSLTSLNGLGTLAFVGGDLTVKHNTFLRSLESLDQVTAVGGTMDVFDNASLPDQPGLEHINASSIKAKKKHRPHVSWITPIGGTPVLKGYLRAVDDSSIVISNYLNKSTPDYFTKSIHVRDVNTMKFRKQGSPVLKGTLIGVLSGIVLGATIGYASKCTKFTSIAFVDEITCIYEKRAKITVLSVGFGTLFGIIGGVVAAKKITIPINGGRNNYKKQKIKLLQYRID